MYVPGSDARGTEQNQSCVVFSVTQSQALRQGLVATESFATLVTLTVLKPGKRSVDTDVVIVHKAASPVSVWEAVKPCAR